MKRPIRDTGLARQVFEEAFSPLRDGVFRIVTEGEGKGRFNWVAQRRDRIYERVKIEADPAGAISLAFCVCCFDDCPTIDSRFSIYWTLDDVPEARDELRDLYLTSGWFSFEPAATGHSPSLRRIVFAASQWAGRALDKGADELKRSRLVKAALELLSAPPADGWDAARTFERLRPLVSPDDYPDSRVRNAASQLAAKAKGVAEWFMF